MYLTELNPGPTIQIYALPAEGRLWPSRIKCEVAFLVALAVHNALSAPRHVLVVAVFNPQFIISSQSYQNIAMCSALCALCAVDAQSTVGDGQRGQLGPIALRTKTTLCQKNIVCAASTKPWTTRLHRRVECGAAGHRSSEWTIHDPVE